MKALHIIFLLLSAISIARADLASEFQDLLVSTWSDVALTLPTKINRFESFAADHVGTDAEIAMDLVVATLKIQLPSVTEGEVEGALKRIQILRPQGWQSAFAGLSLVFLRHDSGDNAMVISNGEALLNCAQLMQLDSDIDPYLAAVKQISPVSKDSVCREVAGLVADSYEKMGNVTKAAALRSAYGVAPE